MKEVILYSAHGSNCSERVEWVLNYKQIPYATIDVSEQDRWQSYLAINPMGYVPCLSLSGLIISESMAIIETLEEGFPSPAILGSTWQDRAQIRAMCEYVNGSLHMPQNRSVLRQLKPDLTDTQKRAFRGSFLAMQLKKLVPQLFKSSSFAITNQFTLADIYIASIYKKSLQHGSSEIDDYQNHLTFLRQFENISASEPKPSNH